MIEKLPGLFNTWEKLKGGKNRVCLLDQKNKKRRMISQIPSKSLGETKFFQLFWLLALLFF